MNSPSLGCLIGVSLGPGDPDLITRGALAALEGNALWSWPVKKAGSTSYALEIVRRAGLAIPTDGITLIFPMTRDPKQLKMAWARVGRTVLERLETGRDVLFLCEGDVSTYSTFGHLSRNVKQLNDQVRVRVIAGVSSPQACAARLGIPLVEQDDTLAMLPADYGVDMVADLLDRFDRLALMKINPVLDEVIDLLDRRGLLPHAHLVERAGTPEERLVTDVGALKGQKLNYLSLLLVRNPHRRKPLMAKSGYRKG
uniref:Precorrin-2 C20-methyltransferase /cobalt-factor II C20-methyltransferase n=1 Tax=Candidatus Kentrum sp. TUN TaxID=2126343 RepID=A0A450ZNJ0_9GAMM|nr:MAG: precorrin-2 C20-methyltransferase /cobalt-factor II C20-methyltransferase [Candidatus Kentron sp. TUN]VFK54106.1 MAG: precorrin-2 C20-methyltransferase /cobalt-factor II C20-methyltransferase [Candidatus Kentron sp. TUN]VFK55290.1 MAG: precorrin-2 C20-methyltransferase /cobalt-factor II C20-methyltransferase [Candidatus Kentron sp. TUN]